jgi:hypothetical protein
MKQALINISIERLTTNINAPLTAVLFCGNDYFSKYAYSLRGFLTSFVSVKDVTNILSNSGPTGNLLFEFQDLNTGLQDDIAVICNEIPLITLITNSISKPFKINNLGYNLNNSTQTAQYREKVSLLDISNFGKKIKDSFTPNQFRMDMSKLNDTIDIPVNYKVEAHTGLAFNFIGANKINLSLTIEQ